MWSLWRRRWWTILVGILPPAFFFIAALGFWLNIGYRHILPILPCMAHLLSSGGDVLGVDDGRMYKWPSLERLPMVDMNGNAQPNYALDITLDNAEP
ncbi:MAG TPA: hypothetical protein ENN19_08035 [Chloroflexi bacterium]|nr:hypothetical protein [Chloroflexota bacterium]